MKLFRWLLDKIRNLLKVYSLSSPMEWVIQRHIHPDFFFVQIGGNDGKTNDPIHRIVKRRKLSGIIVEPVKDYFKELQLTYGGYKNIRLANVAIYAQNQRIKIYRADGTRTDLPDWTKGIASLYPSHFQKSKTSQNSIIEEEVEGITFEKLIDSYSITSIDLIQIDTEGYDYQIIKMIDFEKIHPNIIAFEHGLSDNIMTAEQYAEIFLMLVKKGYKIISLDYDCIAYL